MNNEYYQYEAKVTRQLSDMLNKQKDIDDIIMHLKIAKNELFTMQRDLCKLIKRPERNDENYNEDIVGSVVKQKPKTTRCKPIHNYQPPRKVKS